MGEIDGPHLLPQPDQVRAAVVGKRLRDGESATLIVIYCPSHEAWSFYLDSDPNQAVLVPVGKVGPLVRLLTAVGRGSGGSGG